MYLYFNYLNIKFFFRPSQHLPGKEDQIVATNNSVESLSLNNCNSSNQKSYKNSKSGEKENIQDLANKPTNENETKGKPVFGIKSMPKIIVIKEITINPLKAS